jgi:dephospho-CoA kinase
MLKVAVTGGIGSGKSIVCEVFEKIGIPVFYADKCAKKIMDTDRNIKEELITYFGTDIFDSNEKLMRGKFAEIIFNNKSALLKVNGIVHPAVRSEFEEWVKIQNAPYVIEEAAIIFESGLEHNFDRIISVTAPLELRIQRVMKRDKISRNKVFDRLKNQHTDEGKIKKSDFIIVNDDKEMILPQIINIHCKLL